jgi:hypothetical protein
MSQAQADWIDRALTPGLTLDFDLACPFYGYRAELVTEG